VENLKNLADIRKNRALFSLLEGIIYKDISVNGICIRILGIHYMDYGPDWNIKSHKHSFFECHYVTENNVYTTLNDIEYQVNAGSYYVIPPHTFHSHRQYDNTRHIGFALRWEMVKNTSSIQIQTGLKEAKEIDNLISNFSINVMEDDGTILDGMIGLLKIAEKSSWTLLLQASLFQLIIYIIQKHSSYEWKHCIKTDRKFLDDNTTTAGIRFIEENYKQEIDVKDVANSVHMSYSHLSRLFKAYAGESINNYINNTRIKNAQYLLKCTNKDIAVIAGEVGFKSEYYFCHIFKKTTGISPGAYRKTYFRLTE
jgi:YesN/AraC family two-component response regulator